MLLAEELLLLMVDDASGRKTLGAESLEPALGAAMVVDLVLRERVGIAPAEAGASARGRIRVADASPTDDPELDALLAELQRRDGRTIKDLISPMSGKRITKGLTDRLLARLVAAGVVQLQENKVLGLFPTRRFPTRDPEPEELIRRRLQSALVGGEAPSERTAALIALLDATNRVTAVVTTDDRRALRARAKQIARGDWAAKAVKDAIDETYAVIASVAATTGATSAG
ncbi:MAG TPA: GPP34 family phosphoprotein [Microlunatus sp.]|nr:GPP34 family phosphoprotein [Microlunatus sp.]